MKFEIFEILLPDSFEKIIQKSGRTVRKLFRRYGINIYLDFDKRDWNDIGHWPDDSII